MARHIKEWHVSIKCVHYNVQTYKTTYILEGRSHTHATFVLVNGYYINDYIKHMYFDMIFLLIFITLHEPYI